MTEQKANKFFLLCDSGDFYVWLLKHTNFAHKRLADLTRSITIKNHQKLIELVFIHKQSNLTLYNKFTKNLLAKTAGTPDYILFNENQEELLIIEDSNTAPVGNALLQRQDKLFPLMLDDEVTCPVKYIQYKEGEDKSQSKIRTTEQSWFVKSFAGKRNDFFLFLEANDNIYEKIFELILEHTENKKYKKPIELDELQTLHAEILKSIKTYKDNVFFGKLFKPNGTDAHPVQSTLLLISEVANHLGKEPVQIKCTPEHKLKFMNSTSRRIKKIIENGVKFY